MSKRNKIILTIVAIIILIGVGLLSWAAYTDKIKLKAETKIQEDWTKTAYLTEYRAKNLRTNIEGQNIDAWAGDTIQFRVTVGANTAITNPVIYACTNSSYADDNFEYISVDKQSFTLENRTPYNESCRQGYTCNWQKGYLSKFEIGQTNGTTFSGPVMRAYFNGDQASFSGVKVFKFKGTVKANAPVGKKIKRGWALGWYDWDTNTYEARDWSTGDSTRAIVTIKSKYTCKSDWTCAKDTGGKYYTLTDCQKNCKAPTKYSCQDDGTCIEDPEGIFPTLAACQEVCKAAVRYSCQDDGTCIEDPEGQYSTLAACQEACRKKEPIIKGVKSAYNETQNKNATTVTAKPGDIIRYELNTWNAGTVAENNFVIKDTITEILDYAIIIDLGGGSVSGQEISFPALTLQPGGSSTKNNVVKTFKVKINDSSKWPSGGDFKITNSFNPRDNQTNSTVTVPVGCSIISAVSKSAFNETQNIIATDKKANPGDIIKYTIEAGNTGNIAGDFVMEENLDDILQYAEVIDAGGGKLDIGKEKDNKISWDTNIVSNERVARVFKVKVKDASRWPTLGDLIMSNVYGGTTINIDLEPQSTPQAVVAPAAAVAGQVAKTLTPTGTAVLVIICIALLIILVYWLVKKNLAKKGKK